MTRPLAATALALLLAAAPVRAAPTGSTPVDVTWDRELAQDHDRDHYEQELLAIVEACHALAARELDLPADRRLKVAVLTPAGYARRFGAAASESRGAHYQGGTIFVNGGRRLDDRFAGLMAHEMAHAVLDDRGAGGRLPVWLNEGLAERIRWRRQRLDDLTPDQKTQLQYDGRERRLVPLLSAGDGSFDYLHVYAATLCLEKAVGRAALLEVVHRTVRGERFEKALDRVTRLTPVDLERRFVDWVEHLPIP